jgi:hypothetical protein
MWTRSVLLLSVVLAACAPSTSASVPDLSTTEEADLRSVASTDLASSPDSCPVFLACGNGCDTNACYNACYDAADQNARDLISNLLNCLLDACGVECSSPNTPSSPACTNCRDAAQMTDGACKATLDACLADP